MRRWLLVLFIAALSGRAADSVEDWPRLLGPRGDGTSSETGLLESWPAGGPPVLWDKKVGVGYSGPSVRGDLVVLHHSGDGGEIVECMESATGATRWRYSYPSQFIDPYGYNNGPRATPWLTTNRCYTFGAEGKLLCLDLVTGKLIWERDTAKDWQIPPAFFGVGSSPVLEGNILMVMIGGQPDSGMVGLDADTGKTVWESVGEKNWSGEKMLGWPGEPVIAWKAWDKQASYSTPVVANVHGKRLAFCLMRQGLVALDPLTGKIAFSRWFRAHVEESVNAANPVVVDDMVLISAAYYHVGAVSLRINANDNGFEELWRDTVLETHWSTPIYVDGYLYAFSGRNEPDARFRCVELKTGKLMWDRDERWRPHSYRQPEVYGRGSAILAEGKLVVIGEGGLLGLFRPNPQKAEEISRWQVPSLEHPCWAAPVLSHKRLYLRSEGHLVCLDLARQHRAGISPATGGLRSASALP